MLSGIVKETMLRFEKLEAENWARTSLNFHNVANANENFRYRGWLYEESSALLTQAV